MAQVVILRIIRRAPKCNYSEVNKKLTFFPQEVAGLVSFQFSYMSLSLNLAIRYLDSGWHWLRTNAMLWGDGLGSRIGSGRLVRELLQ